MSDYDKLKDALKQAKKLDYSNGMATESIDIKTKYGDISVIRKCGNLHRGEIFLIRVRENRELGHISANRKEIAAKLRHMSILKDCDVTINFKSYPKHLEYNYNAIVPVKIFNFL